MDSYKNPLSSIYHDETTVMGLATPAKTKELYLSDMKLPTPLCITTVGTESRELVPQVLGPQIFHKLKRSRSIIIATLQIGMCADNLLLDLR